MSIGTALGPVLFMIHRATALGRCSLGRHATMNRGAVNISRLYSCSNGCTYATHHHCNASDNVEGLMSHVPSHTDHMVMTAM